jgi:hypothetical protein
MNLLLRSILILLALQLALPQLATPHPASAQTPNPITYPEPGHYLGFVSFILHSDYVITSGGGNTINNIDYEGLWMVNDARIEMDIGGPKDPWTISSTDLKPVIVVMDYTQSATVKDPFGDCILGATIDGLAKYHLEKGYYYFNTQDFEALLALKSNTTTSFEKTKAFGSLPGCDKQTLPDSIWRSGEGIINFNSTKINSIHLVIDPLKSNQGDKGIIGGRCSEPEWVSDGSTERDTARCKWTAYMVNKGWRKAVNK